MKKEITSNSMVRLGVEKHLCNVKETQYFPKKFTIFRSLDENISMLGRSSLTGGWSYLSTGPV